MDVYDVSTGAWTVTELTSTARSGAAAAGAGNKIAIAGGIRYVYVQVTAPRHLLYA